MSDLKLFRLSGSSVSELERAPSDLEKALQTLIERNLETFLGVKFLASEYITTNGGRMDTLGIDENGCPVIIEYKRTRDENVINQGLFYLDWLMDHRGDFKLLVIQQLGQEAADAIEWSAPRLICIAGDFTRYDEHAVKQISRNIELIRYRKFGGDLILLDLMTAVSATPRRQGGDGLPSNSSGTAVYKTVSEFLGDADERLTNLYEDLRAYVTGLGDDVQEKTLRFYIAFKRIKNFACVEVRTQLGCLKLFLKVDPDDIELEPGFTRDVRNVGHFGTGDLEVTITNASDLERAKPLIVKSYEVS
tara:strand:+ start:1874 stop:2788 length:915 start_codon:yes stop_codon:yes gene_type:complete